MRRLVPISLPVFFVLACGGSSPDDTEQGANAERAVLTSGTGLHFPVGSTVYAESEWGHSILLFESPLAENVFCATGERQGRHVEIFVPKSRADSSELLFQGEVSGSIVEEEGTSWRSTSGNATFAFHGDPSWAVTGSFTLSDSFEALDGTFEAGRCASRPWFEGGAGANRASGTLGFEVRSGVGVTRRGRYQLFLVAPPIGDGTCEALLDEEIQLSEDFEGLMIQFDRTAEGPTETFTEENRIQLSRAAMSGVIGTLGPYEAHELTVAMNFQGARVWGTYEAEFLGRNGALESMEGAFDITVCELP